LARQKQPDCFFSFSYSQIENRFLIPPFFDGQC